jgi:DNA polymerase-1
MSHLVLIDGHHLMHRAYWAIPRTLKTRAGEQVNTVFGVASMMLHILKKEEPTHFLFCFDAGDETFRHEENATYKDGRATTPDDFYIQIPRVMELVETFGIRHVSEKKYEADDFLCTYAKRGEEAGMRVTIVTGDRDAFQLATDKIHIAIPHSGYLQAEYLGPVEIEAKYGIRPDQVPAYKGLVGDASDNLPGVVGIGPKTAAELLQAYDTLESVYEHLADIRPSVREKLERDKEQAFFCQHMALLISDIPLKVALDEVKMQHLPAARVAEFFTDLEFNLLTRRFREFLQTPYGLSAFDGAADVSAKHEQTQSQPSNQLTLF